jgi:hypothetical protein
VAQHDGRAVAGDFDDVFGGVRTRRGEICGDDLVDTLAVVIEQFSERGGARSEIRMQFQEGAGDGNRLRAGETNYANSAAAWRSG